jgi:hypothetical protein
MLDLQDTAAITATWQHIGGQVEMALVLGRPVAGSAGPGGVGLGSEKKEEYKKKRPMGHLNYLKLFSLPISFP